MNQVGRVQSCDRESAAGATVLGHGSARYAFRLALEHASARVACSQPLVPEAHPGHGGRYELVSLQALGVGLTVDNVLAGRGSRSGGVRLRTPSAAAEGDDVRRAAQVLGQVRIDSDERLEVYP